MIKILLGRLDGDKEFFNKYSTGRGDERSIGIEERLRLAGSVFSFLLFSEMRMKR